MSDFIGNFRQLTTGKLHIRSQLTIGNQAIISNNGNTYYVDSTASNKSDTNTGKSWAHPLATLDGAINKCTANNGDVILLAPGHSETYTTTGAKAVFDIAGITVISTGMGTDRATFNFGHTGATFTISAASITLVGLLFITAVDQVVTFGTISGADCTLIECETRDVTDKEVVDAFICTGARLTVYKHYHNGYTGGDANARVFKMNGVAGALFDGCRFLGKVTTGVINFVTTACTNVIVKNCDFLVTSTTNLSKNVVDTITGSTWECNGCFDLGAGAGFSGGSGGALAVDDIASIYSRLGAPAGASVSADIAAIKSIVDDVKSYTDTEIAAIKAKTDNLPASPCATADVANALVDVKNKDIGATFSAATDSLEAISEKVGELADVAGTTSIIAYLKAIKAKTDTIT
jgi:hypothetical protein